MTRNGWSPVLVQRYRTWNEDRPSSTVVLSKKQHNRFLQSFWERCRWSKDWNTAVTFTSRYVLVSEWRERLFRKHHGEGDKAARSVKYFVETAFFVSFWNFVTIFLMKMSCDVSHWLRWRIEVLYDVSHWLTSRKDVLYDVSHWLTSWKEVLYDVSHWLTSWKEVLYDVSHWLTS
jgi:hypothetical protein